MTCTGGNCVCKTARNGTGQFVARVCKCEECTCEPPQDTLYKKMLRFLRGQ